jgi:hypothetical protein
MKLEVGEQQWARYTAEVVVGQGDIFKRIPGKIIEDLEP